MDLIQVAQKVTPPVCKLGDYGKYLYKQQKKEKKSKSKKGGELKGVRLSFNISSHDMNTKIRQAKSFLEEGNKVRIEMKLRGREKALQKHAREKVKEFLQKLKEQISFEVEKKLKKKPRGLTMIIYHTTKK